MAIDASVRAFLEGPRFAVISTLNQDGTPQQTAIWYELRGDEIVMNTALSRVKANNLARDPRVSVCVVDGYQAVTVAGTARLVNDQSVAQEDIRSLAIRYSGQDEGERRAKQFAQQERVSIYVPLTRIVSYGL